MSLQTAPYNDSMRIGSGFNSYTQQLCIDNAVIKGDKGPATEADLKPKLPDANANTVSQLVTFTSKFVENSSDITEAMNVSGHLEIKYNGIGVNGSGSYIDSSTVKESDINYFVQVKVVNQQLVPEDLSRFNAIANVSADDRNRFTRIYGDSFVSGFLEGGEFNALLSVKVADKSKVKTIKGALSLNLSAAGFGISGSVEGGYDQEEVLKNSETSITVSWAGGGDIQDGNKNKGWSIESMAAAAFSFAERVRVCPERTQAILTKYSALRSYQVQTNKGSPLDYENAGVYTNALLESYMEYKSVAKDIQRMTQEVSDGVSTLLKLPASAEAEKGIKSLVDDWVKIKKAEASNKQSPVEPKPEDFDYIPSEAYNEDLFGLEKARLHCRLQMVLIVQEVDEVAKDPGVAVDPYRVGKFLNPMIFRELLPATESPLLDSVAEATLWEVTHASNNARKVYIKNHDTQKYLSHHRVPFLDCTMSDTTHGLWELLQVKGSENRFRLANKESDDRYYVTSIMEGCSSHDLAEKDHSSGVIFIPAELKV